MTTDDPSSLPKLVHDLNNRLGSLLAAAEMLQMDQPSPKTVERARVIETKALEMREIIREIQAHYVK